MIGKMKYAKMVKEIEGGALAGNIEPQLGSSYECK